MEWTFHGSLAAGEEHYYESADGRAQVFPHPDSGWELQVDGSDDTSVFPTAEAAMAGYQR